MTVRGQDFILKEQFGDRYVSCQCSSSKFEVSVSRTGFWWLTCCSCGKPFILSNVLNSILKEVAL